jgi:hypothetical protein
MKPFHMTAPRGGGKLRADRIASRKWLAAALVTACQLGLAKSAQAWLFVEHTVIGRSAVAQLDDNRRRVLEQAWSSFVKGDNFGSTQVCRDVTAPDTPVEYPPYPNEKAFNTCVDLPAMAALAGDHSCDQTDLALTLQADWVGDLIESFRDNYEKIRKTTLDSTERVSLWHKSHLDAQRIDGAYLSRAQQNGAHFVLPRNMRDGRAERVEEYVARVAQMGAPSNAVGIYVTYHARALNAATHAQCKADSPCANPDQARAAVLFEAVALHFLEDAFSSGHVAGAPQDADRAMRMGTHDYYCRRGLSVVTWSGEAYPAHGDAYLQPVDKSIASIAVRASLTQLVDALLGTGVPACDSGPMDICSEAAIPGVPAECAAAMVPAILKLFPAPALNTVLEPPFRNEIGTFARFSVAAKAGVGLTTVVPADSLPPAQVVPTAGLEGGIGLGFSLAGVTTASSDALAFVQLGLVADMGQETEWCFICNRIQIQEPIGTRLGVAVRIRMPYWAIPADFIPLGLLAAAGWKWSFNRLVDSSAGGLYGHWQNVRPLGHAHAWQIVLGREFEYTWYQLSRPRTAISFDLISSHAIAVPLVDLILTRYFSELTSTDLKFELAYRYEVSDLVHAHFIVLSLGSDTNLYFSGF